MFGTGDGKEYKRIKNMYKKYIETYKALNNGSVEGATPFNEFYMRYTYIGKYNDHRVLLKLGSK